MRAFVAIELPEGVRRTIARRTTTLRERARGWRWVAPDRVHLTLAFLDEIDPERLGDWRDGLAEAAAGAPRFRFRVGGFGTFPPRGVPRVLWTGVRDVRPSGALEVVAARVRAAAAALGVEIDRRPFRAHLTLARARRGERPGRPVADEFDADAAIEVVEIVLYRSDLGPDGPRHTPLARLPLGDDDGRGAR